MGFSKKGYRDPLVALFNNLKREAIKRQARYKIDNEIVALGVKNSYYFLKFLVGCYNGEFSQEEVDRLAKLALSVLSIPPVFYAKMWGNIRDKILLTYKELLKPLFDDNTNSENDNPENNPKNDKKDDKSDNNSDKNNFGNLKKFETLLAGMGYDFCIDPSTLFSLILQRPELLNTLHAIGFCTSH